jgi:ATP-dependent helicase HrpA
LTSESDFAALLRLWRWFKNETEGKSQSAFRRLCRDNFLSYPRMRDWIDLVERIETLSKQMGLNFQKNQESNDSLHRALLAGLLGRIGRRDKETGEYRGAHGVRFLIFPGSGLVKLSRDAAKKNSKNSLSPEKVSSREKSSVSRDWLMAGELMETSRLFARIAAYINPSWIEEIAGSLCKRAYYSPFWDAQNGYARIMERVTFNGFTLADGRKKDLSRIAPSEARDMLIQCGLAEGQIINPPQFLKANLARIRKIQEIEEKTRCTGQLVDWQKIIEFYSKRIPDEVCTINELRRWVKGLPQSEVEALYMRESDFMVPDHLAQGFPDCIVIGDIKFPLRYRHSIDDREDGITCVSRVEHLTLLRAWPHDWLVPGAVDHKISWMLLALPAKIRRQLQPIEQAVNICRHKMDYGKGALTESLALVLRQEWGIEVTPSIWTEAKMPAYLRVKFQAINSDGKILGQSRELESLIKLYCSNNDVKDSVRKNQQQRWQRDNMTIWDCEALPVSVNLGTATMPIINYPALVDRQTSVSLQLFQNKINAHGEHLAGVCRLLLLGLDRTARRIFNTQLFPKPVLKWLQNNGFAHDSMIDDIARTVIRRVGLDEKEEVRDAAVFEQRLKLCSQNVGIVYTETFRLINAILHTAIELEKGIEKLPTTSKAGLLDALACLLFPGFVWSVAWSQLKHYPRYLEGMRWRCERYALDPVADARRQTLFEPYWQRYADFIVIDDKAPYDAVALDNYRWLLEEYRISLFAQSLGTAITVSPKRLDAAWEQVLK